MPTQKRYSPEGRSHRGTHDQSDPGYRLDDVNTCSLLRITEIPHCRSPKFPRWIDGSEAT